MTLRVHHLNCATLHPPGGRLVGGVPGRARLVCHCLLIETADSLVLVDTGIGLHTIAAPRRHLGSGFLRLVRPHLDPDESAAHQVARLGYDASDVRHVVLTHLDLDHAGGLADFPAAQVHVHEAEHRAAAAPQTPAERRRYRPTQWAHRPQWVTHAAGGGEEWFGFTAVRDIPGLPPEILLIPLAGHTRGHIGVAVRVADTGSTQWLLHGGDAYFFHGQVARDGARTPSGMALYQRLVDTDHTARLDNQARLGELARDHDTVTVFSAHDPTEYDRLRGTDAAMHD